MQLLFKSYVFMLELNFGKANVGEVRRSARKFSTADTAIIYSFI